MTFWPSGRALRLAARVRVLLHASANVVSPLGLVVLLAALTGGAVAFVVLTLGTSCVNPPVSIPRLEVAFSAARLSALLGLEGDCGAPIVKSFLVPGVVLAVVYPWLLAALYVWAERWRFTTPRDALGGAAPARSDHDRHDRRARFFVAAALLAGLCNVVEHLLLTWAMRDAARDQWPHTLLTLLGSGAAALKYLLLLAVAYGLVAELFDGPRGDVLGRLRFSALAVVLGAVPLLALPQGQDILQRLVEGVHRDARVGWGVAAVAFGATAIWYCGRKLLQVAPVGDGTDPWCDFFAEQLPRMLGISALALGGAAFARAGLGLWWFAAAAAAGLVASLVIEWLASRRGGGRGGGPALVRLRLVEAAAAVVVTAAVLAIGWWSTSRGNDGRYFGLAEMGRLWLAAGACLVLAWAFYFRVYFRRDLRAAKEARAAGGGGATYAEARRRLRAQAVGREGGALGAWGAAALAAGVIASAVFFALFVNKPVPTARWLGPLWVLTLAVANAVMFGSVFAWVGVRFRIPVVRLGMALTLLCSVCNDNHVVPHAPHTSVTQRPPLDAHFQAWRAAGRLTNDAPVVLVAAQGGGLRAAYWTALTLAYLQDADSTFARHVYAVSGISGGSLGAAVFAALVRDAGRTPGGVASLPCAREAPPDTATNPGGRFTACVRRYMRDDYLSPVLAKLVAPDFVQRFVPYPDTALDRSKALEGSWAVSYDAVAGRPTFHEPFLMLRSDSTPLPAIVMNTTHVESGRRYVEAPMTFGDVLRDAGDVLGIMNSDLPLAAAVHNSARFTLVSPAGQLAREPGSDSGRVVDGGYFENSGLTTLRELRDRVTKLGARSVVLYLCNDPVQCRKDVEPDTTRIPEGLAHEISSPILAVLHTREARGSLARAQAVHDDFAHFEQLNVCADMLERHAATDSARAVAEKSELGRDRVVSPPLGWSLSQLARDWMDSSLGHTAGETSPCRSRNRAALDSVLAWIRR